MKKSTSDSMESMNNTLSSAAMKRMQKRMMKKTESVKSIWRLTRSVQGTQCSSAGNAYVSEKRPTPYGENLSFQAKYKVRDRIIGL